MNTFLGQDKLNTNYFISDTFMQIRRSTFRVIDIPRRSIPKKYNNVVSLYFKYPGRIA